MISNFSNELYAASIIVLISKTRKEKQRCKVGYSLSCTFGQIYPISLVLQNIPLSNIFLLNSWYHLLGDHLCRMKILR